ncbi:MAG: hypothetical protein ACK56I_20360, partial [bacterium]
MSHGHGGFARAHLVQGLLCRLLCSRHLPAAQRNTSVLPLWPSAPYPCGNMHPVSGRHLLQHDLPLVCG